MEPRIVFLQPKIGMAAAALSGLVVTGLGNMDSLLSVQSSSIATNGFSHSLEDSSLPPSFSRLPPDGHEFPPNYQEPLRTAASVTMTSDLSLTKASENSSVMNSPPDSPPPPLPASCPPQKDSTEALAPPPRPKSLPPAPPTRKPPPHHKDMSPGSFSSRLPPTRANPERRHWMKDEKSEKSVRDKIAMFQKEGSSGGNSPVAPSTPPVPAVRSPAKYEMSEDAGHRSRKVPHWDDPLARHHLSKSMLGVDGLGRVSDHHSAVSPGMHSSGMLYKSAAHNSSGDVSNSADGHGDGSRTLDFARTRSTMDLTSSSNSCSPDSSLSSASSYSSGGVSYATLPRKPTAIPRPPPVAAERTSASLLEHRPSSPEPALWRSPNYPTARSSTLHSRSQSLVDVATPKRHSIGGNYSYWYNYSNGKEDAHKSTLNAMIEQRRKNVSKLRGLVIPEKAEVARCEQSLFDLPEIKSRDAIIISNNCKTSTLPRYDSKQQKRWSESMNGHSMKTQNSANSNHNSIISNGVTLTSPPWKSQAPLPDLPKYSPAFKRRSLSVHGLTSSPLDSSRDDFRHHSQESSKIIPPSKPPRSSNGYGLVPSSPLGPEPKSLESITSPRSDSSFDFGQICHTDSSKEDEVVPVIKSNGTPSAYADGHNGKSSHRGLLHVPNSRGASAEDSDNDSAVSSSRSSISHGFSPPSSPLPGDTSDGGHRPSAPRQHISRERIHSDERNRALTSSRRSAGSASERTMSPDRRPLRRTLSSETTASVSSAASTASTVTSGSQDGGHGGSGSDSSSNRRVLKAQSVEAINRKNVLSSAKYSSGRDVKVGSPLIKRKFDEDGSGTEADVEDAAKATTNQNPTSPLARSNGITHYQTSREVNDLHDIEAAMNMDIKVAYVDEIIEYPFVNGNVELVEPAMPVQRRVAEPYTSMSSSPRATSPISEYSTTESVCGSHKEDKKAEVHAVDDVSAGEEVKRDSFTSPSGVRIDRWMELEKKYSPKTEVRQTLNVQESHTYKTPSFEDEIDFLSRKVGSDGDKSRSRSYSEKQDSGNAFRSIAEKWQIISNDASTLPSPTNPVAASSTITTSTTVANGLTRKTSKKSASESHEDRHVSSTPEGSRLKLDESYTVLSSMETTSLTSSAQTNGDVLKSDAVRLREKKTNPSRPLSFSDCSEKTLSLGKDSFSPSEGRLKMNRQESTPEPRSSALLSPTTTVAPTLGAQRTNNRRSVSVNDIRKAFEKTELPVANGRSSTTSRSKVSSMTTAGPGTAVHTRVSSLDSTTSEESYMPAPAHHGSVNNLASNHRDQFGSITSLASSTSLISPQELQQLIEEANQSLDEASSNGSGTPLVHEVEVVVLHREMAGSSVGITLAGGADYEAKEITVHKVLAGSPAERDGRVQRGDRILSINGKSTKGATHREAISILKAPRSEVVLVVSRSRPENSQSHPTSPQGTNGAAELSMAALSAATIRSIGSTNRPPRILEQPSEGNGEIVEETAENKLEEESRGPPETLVLTKDGAGLGFSLEGGKDSPSGDKPLTVKKIFTGGAAEKHGGLHVGDELLVVNGIDVTPLSRIEAWGIMKKLPDGMVSLTIRRKI
ncbi:serine/arginine repetitive matrix protein 2-like isoform X2 [Ischnura elegans]|uniref:serine/arginine repetitive matrix protein 2-like isoform X2 n=1 Tax=Ischnura elegans TaxID=197161 RepID=UPI001ED89FA1|nr:serine/arginine repetitive matrix protein 2-like isoform X2 [Ischnura elegans]